MSQTLFPVAFNQQDELLLVRVVYNTDEYHRTQQNTFDVIFNNLPSNFILTFNGINMKIHA